MLLASVVSRRTSDSENAFSRSMLSRPIMPRTSAPTMMGTRTRLRAGAVPGSVWVTMPSASMVASSFSLMRSGCRVRMTCWPSDEIGLSGMS